MNNFKIDRRALVTRHNPNYRQPAKNAPLSVGNGSFCYTADFAGLQSFGSGYSYFPLCTMSEWGWHSYPDAGRDPADLRLTPFDTWGREVGYAVDGSGQEELYNSLRQNPHRFNLGSIGFDLPDSAIDDCTGVNQVLDLWSGIIDSSFSLWREKINIRTFVHAGEDTVCIRVTSPLLEKQKLRIKLSFPYGSHTKTGGDFSLGSRHTSIPHRISASLLNINRCMDGTVYTVQVLTDENSFYQQQQGEAHEFFFGSKNGSLTIAFRFVRNGAALTAAADQLCDRFYGEAERATMAFWENYWTEGGAVDLGDSPAAGAGELERRIVL
ncbi:MAG: hypothetical protein FWF22_08915, partial [Treponema sp.]|nr:hypothetical protein [Treponema sp.]